jgi:hypothetical protein
MHPREPSKNECKAGYSTLDLLPRQAKRRLGALTASAVFASCSVVPDSLTHNFEGDRFAIQRFLDPVSLGFERRVSVAR